VNYHNTVIRTDVTSECCSNDNNDRAKSNTVGEGNVGEDVKIDYNLTLTQNDLGHDILSRASQILRVALDANDICMR